MKLDLTATNGSDRTYVRTVQRPIVAWKQSSLQTEGSIIDEGP